MDSLIRLRQLNQNDLSGFIGRVLFPVLGASGLGFSGYSIIPSGSGVFNLGSNDRPFNDIYTLDVNIPSGSGIHFGPNCFFTAYTSGNVAVLKVNNYTITSSGTMTTIMGPPGPSGATGAIGPSGASGVYVTGAQSYNGNMMRLLLSNGRIVSGINLPSGVQGATGIGMTGFLQSGNYLLPRFTNGTTGSPIPVVAGPQGVKGDIGGITINFGQFTGHLSGQIAPDIYIANIDPASNGHNPTLRFIRGMSYYLNLSGMGVQWVTTTGQYGTPTGTFATNLFIDEYGKTGYLKFAIFDSTIINNPNDWNFTGRVVFPESSFDWQTDMMDYVKNDEFMPDWTQNAYKNILSFHVSFGAQDSYKYGFIRYNLDDSVYDELSQPYGCYILGNAEVSFFGPMGPSGQKGDPGIDGPEGPPGPAGLGGSPGVGITGVYRNPDINNPNQIRFLFSDNTYSDWITLPAGGATGPQGVQGPAGISIASASGQNGNLILTLSNGTVLSPIPMPAGPQGPQGYADTYAANFLPSEVSITGRVNAFNKQWSGQSTWTLSTGSGMFLDPGDSVWFQHDTLKNKAYSPWQRLILADGNYTGSRYMYLAVRTFDSTAGELQATVTDNPYPPIGKSGNHMWWNQFNSMNLNLGGLGSPGPQGDIGPQGPQGIQGNTGVAIFNFSGINAVDTVHYTLNCTPYTAYTITIGSGNTSNYYDNYFNFNLSKFATGQTVQMRMTNLGSLSPDQGVIIHWDSFVKFPNNVPGPAPLPGKTNIFTFVRHPDFQGSPQIFCTYATNFV